MEKPKDGISTLIWVFLFVELVFAFNWLVWSTYTIIHDFDVMRGWFIDMQAKQRGPTMSAPKLVPTTTTLP